MGDVSVMARRLPDGGIQYGWSGNGGYFRAVGSTLLYYDTDEAVDRLFSMGELSQVSYPDSERGLLPDFFRNTPSGRPLHQDASEQWMFSRICFVDYGYLRELDGEWYSVNPGPFRVKMPLGLVGNHLDERGFEYSFFREVEKKILKYMMTEYYEENEEFRQHLAGLSLQPEKIYEDLSVYECPLYDLYDKYPKVFEFFDDWIVVDCDENYQDITAIYLRKQVPDEQRTETCDWYQPVPKKHPDYDKALSNLYIGYIARDLRRIHAGEYDKTAAEMRSRDMLLLALVQEGRCEKDAREEGKDRFHGEAFEAYTAAFLYGAMEVDERLACKMLQHEDREEAAKIMKLCMPKTLDIEAYQKKLKEENTTPVQKRAVSEKKTAEMHDTSKKSKKHINLNERQKIILENIRNLMDSCGWSAEQAMKALKIAENDQTVYRELL